MLSVYMLPMLMRPLDTIANFKSYMCGFFAYIVMLPIFTNVFQIYSMCNLHDVSWGNRPTSTGQEAFSDAKKEQEKAEGDYKVFRTNFVMFWLAANIGYYILIVELVQAGTGQTYYDHDSGYLVGFSLYLAAIVVFRVFFASIYILKWKCRYNCSKTYRVRQQNLVKEFKQIKSESKNGESTDDEAIEEELQKIYAKNKAEIQQNRDQSILMTESYRMQPISDHKSNLDATLLFMGKQKEAKEDSDDDYDFKEFENAEVEEAEDRIYSVYK